VHQQLENKNVIKEHLKLPSQFLGPTNCPAGFHAIRPTVAAPDVWNALLIHLHAPSITTEQFRVRLNQSLCTDRQTPWRTFAEGRTYLLIY